MIVAELPDHCFRYFLRFVDYLRINYASIIDAGVSLVTVNEHIAHCMLRTLFFRVGHDPADPHIAKTHKNYKYRQVKLSHSYPSQVLHIGRILVEDIIGIAKVHLILVGWCRTTNKCFGFFLHLLLLWLFQCYFEFVYTFSLRLRFLWNRVSISQLLSGPHLHFFNYFFELFWQLRIGCWLIVPHATGNSFLICLLCIRLNVKFIVAAHLCCLCLYIINKLLALQ